MYEAIPEQEEHEQLSFHPLQLVGREIDFNNLESWQSTPLLTSMFRESSTLPSNVRQLNGPYYQDTCELLMAVDELIPHIRPDFGPEHLMPYQSRQVEKEVFSLSYTQNRDLEELRKARWESFEELGQQRAVKAADTIIIHGVLESPPYHQDGRDYARACFRTCFRMVFDGITGSTPSNEDMVEAIESVHGTHLISDEDYLKIFSSPTFKKLFPDMSTQVATITGADLETINAIAEGIKQKSSDAKVFCIVNLQTETLSVKDVWHTNILLGVDEDNVVTHDPSQHIGVGMASKEQSKQRFHERWAVGFNRAHLIIAA